MSVRIAHLKRLEPKADWYWMETQNSVLITDTGMNHQNFWYVTDSTWAVISQQIEIELTATLSSYRFDPLDRRPGNSGLEQTWNREETFQLGHSHQGRKSTWLYPHACSGEFHFGIFPIPEIRFGLFRNRASSDIKFSYAVFVKQYGLIIGTTRSLL